MKFKAQADINGVDKIPLGPGFKTVTVTLECVAKDSLSYEDDMFNVRITIGNESAYVDADELIRAATAVSGGK